MTGLTGFENRFDRFEPVWGWGWGARWRVGVGASGPRGDWARGFIRGYVAQEEERAGDVSMHEVLREFAEYHEKRCCVCAKKEKKYVIDMEKEKELEKDKCEKEKVKRKDVGEEERACKRLKDGGEEEECTKDEEEAICYFCTFKDDGDMCHFCAKACMEEDLAIKRHREWLDLRDIVEKGREPKTKEELRLCREDLKQMNVSIERLDGVFPLQEFKFGGFNNFIGCKIWFDRKSWVYFKIYSVRKRCFFEEASPEYYSNAVLRTCFNERIRDKAFLKMLYANGILAAEMVGNEHSYNMV